MGIMDDDKIVRFIPKVGIELIVAEIDLPHRGVEVEKDALEGMMYGFGHRVELIGSTHDLPVVREAEILHQGNDAIQEFGDSAAKCRRIEVKDSRVTEWLG